MTVLCMFALNIFQCGNCDCSCKCEPPECDNVNCCCFVISSHQPQPLQQQGEPGYGVPGSARGPGVAYPQGGSIRGYEDSWGRSHGPSRGESHNAGSRPPSRHGNWETSHPPSRGSHWDSSGPPSHHGHRESTRPISYTERY